MKRSIYILILLALFFTISIFGCSDTTEQISVISREDGSGTRGAFVELFGIEEKTANGNKIDHTTSAAEITNNTAVMMMTVSGDERAIGYISLGSLNDMVKAVKIDGAEASVKNIRNGTYTISRPFKIVTKKEISPAAQEFINFIQSANGQNIVEAKGYIKIKNMGIYNGNKISGKVIVVGSSSVAPIMEALREAYQKINPNADIEIQQSDSSTGVSSTAEDICDIGMISRELKESEIQKGLSSIIIAQDGLAVIINKKNSVETLTKKQVRDIFTGKIVTWLTIQ
jgi:phosphate transport system substrate-binding protein